MMNYSWKFSRHALFSLSGISVLLVLFGAITAQGATYHVATTGNDANPGTLNQPFKSFKKGVSQLQPGDTLYIRGGLYTEQIDLQTPNKTGTAGNYITIGGYPGETVTLKFSDTLNPGYGPIKARGNRGYFIFENLILDGSASTDASRSNWAIRDGNHHFILRNLEIKNFKNVSAIFIKAENITVQNCKLHDQVSTLGTSGTYHYGIYLSDGNNILIEGSDFYNNAGGGMQIYPGPLSKVVIRNNKFHDNNTKTTIHIGGLIVMSAKGNISDVTIYNNLLYNNGSAPTSGDAPGLRVEAASSTTTTGVKVWNNTIYNNKGYGIKIGSGVSIAAQNNIIFENTKGEILNLGSGSLINHNLTTDPKFVKAEAFDFRLQANSRAIDEGIDLGEVATDFKNLPRPQGMAYDIGALEGNGSDIKSISTPQKLSIR